MTGYLWVARVDPGFDTPLVRFVAEPIGDDRGSSYGSDMRVKLI